MSATRLSVLGALTRLWLLRRLPGPLPAMSEWMLCVLAVASFALWLVIDRATVGPDAEFLPYNIPLVGWFLLIGLTMAWAIARRSSPPISFRDAVFVMIALTPVVIVATGLAEEFAPESALMYVYSALALYIVVYVARAARSLTDRPQIPAAAVVALILIAVGSFNSVYAVDPTLWYDPQPDEDAAAPSSNWARTEPILFSQAARIDAAAAKLKTSPSDAPQVFFVGFAGVGEQRVFAEEIKLAAFNIGEKYGSGNRTMLLLNDQRDLEKQPLATVTGLRHALKAVAAHMRIDRDVLFLALSSHGGADPVLSVSNGMLPLQDLTADALASAVKESGIKWKLIVISACHAGAFINALKDDHTAILTAAAAEKTSFGCSDDRDLTYFGEAFYRDAIPTTPTLREAFEETKRNIAVREKEENIEASNPQAFYGRLIERKLAEIESKP